MNLDYHWTATSPRRYAQGERFSALIIPREHGAEVEIGDLVKVKSTRSGAEFIAPIIAIRAVDQSGTWVVTENLPWTLLSVAAERLDAEAAAAQTAAEAHRTHRIEYIMVKAGICLYCGEPQDDCPCYEDEKQLAQERRQKRLQTEAQERQERERKAQAEARRAHRAEVEARRQAMRAKIKTNPQLLINAFLEADGDWLYTAHILGIVYLKYFTPNDEWDEGQMRGQIKILAKQVAPELLDPGFLKNDRRPNPNS